MKNNHAVLFLCLLVGLFSAVTYGWDGSGVEKVIVKSKTADVFLKMDPTSLVIRQVAEGVVLNAERLGLEWFKVTFPPDDQGLTAIGYIRSSDVAPDPTVLYILSLKNGESIKGRIVAGSVDEVKVDTGSFTATIKTADILEMKPAEESTGSKITAAPPRKNSSENAPPLARTDNEPAKKSPSRFSIAFNPGLGIGLFQTNDLNNYIDYLASVYDDPTDYFDWKKTNLCMNFGLEAIYQISRSFGIGLGVGYLQYGSSGKYGWDDGDEYSHHEYNYTIRAVTIQANLYQSFSLGRNFSLLLTGGGDAFFSFLNVKENWDRDYWEVFYIPWEFYWIDHYEGNDDYEDRYNGLSLGFHAGILFQIDLSPRVALVFGSQFQWARLTDFSWKEHLYNGKSSSETEEGTLWFYDYPKGSKYFSILTNPPTNENYHKANFDLSGISFRAGIKIGL